MTNLLAALKSFGVNNKVKTEEGNQGILYLLTASTFKEITLNQGNLGIFRTF